MKGTLVRVHKGGRDNPLTVGLKWVFHVDWDTMLEWRDDMVRIIVRCDGSIRWATAEAPVRHYGIALVTMDQGVDKAKFVKMVAGVLKAATCLATCSVVPTPIPSDQLFFNLQILFDGAFRRMSLHQLWPASLIVDKAVVRHDTQYGNRLEELQPTDGYNGPSWSEILFG